MLWHCPSWNPMEFEAVALLFCLRQPPTPRTRQWRCFFGITLTFPHFKFLQIGHFPMDPSIVTTFELHLTIQVLLYSQYIFKSQGVLPLAIYLSYENTCTGKHGGDDPSPPDPDQHRAQDRRQTHAGLKIHSLFYCFCILVFEGSHWPQVQDNQEEAVQVLDLKLGRWMDNDALSWQRCLLDSEILTICLID